MTKITQVLQTPTFKKAIKKLHPNQKKDLDKAVQELMANPLSGDQKKGDLGFLQVYKFTMAKQLTLLGYSYYDGAIVLTLIAVGTHENFYRDIKTRG